MAAAPNSVEPRFFRLPDVLRIIPVSKSVFWRNVQQGEFPRPVKLTARTSAWRAEDVYALADRLAKAAA